jgi:predicted alpha/beta hydrolase family esterase
MRSMQHGSGKRDYVRAVNDGQGLPDPARHRDHRPPGHWQHWPAGELHEAGCRVLYPGLPDPDAPSLATWQASLHDHLDELADDQRIVICHSLACSLWFSTARALTSTRRAHRLMFVSPPAPDRLPQSAANFGRLFDPTAVAASVIDELAITCSDSDPYNPGGAQAMYGDPLGVDATVVHGGGHITPDDGYGPWPFVKAWCLRPGLS